MGLHHTGLHFFDSYYYNDKTPRYDVPFQPCIEPVRCADHSIEFGEKEGGRAKEDAYSVVAVMID